MLDSKDQNPCRNYCKPTYCRYLQNKYFQHFEVFFAHLAK